MTPTKARAASFAAASLALAALTAWLLFGRGPLPIQTDLLAMLPKTEGNALAETALARLATATGDRVVLLVAGPDAAAKAAARDLGAELKHSPAFASVTAELPPFDLKTFVQPYLAHRFQLLDASARAALSKPDYDPARALARHINQPFATAVAVPLGDDPFGWLGGWLATQPWNRSPLTPEDGLLVAHDGDEAYVMVLATLAGSAYDDAVQDTSLAAIARAWRDVRARQPEVRLIRTGAVFYAAAARSQAEHDLHLVGWISSLGIALLLLLVFRSSGPLAVAFLSTAIGILAATCLSLVVFGKIYVLTLVFGAALLGEAVDYSIQYLTARANAGPRWDTRRGVAQVRPALLIALATSLAGYALLAAVPFSPLRQMAVFAMTGMAVACASVMWLLPALLARPAKPITPAVVRAAAALQRACARAFRGRAGWILAAVALLAAIPGWQRLGHDDDIHLLIAPPATLRQQESTIRRVSGLGNGTQFFLVRGDSAEQVLEREQALEARLDRGTEAPGWIGIAGMVPSQRRQAANHALLAPLFADPTRMIDWLTAAGLRADAAAAYVAAWPGTPLKLDDWLASDVAKPFRHLWLDRAAGGPASIVVPGDTQTIADLRAAARGLAGVTLVDKPASVSALFGRYRRYASWWLLAAVGLVGVIFGFRYGWRDAFKLAAPPVFGIGATLATLGYLGQPLTLFNALALMLVLGVGANYAVFLREGEPFAADQPGAMYASVLLSALTALLSFGLLSLSSMPALADFGMTLLLGIAFTAVLVPISAHAAPASVVKS